MLALSTVAHMAAWSANPDLNGRACATRSGTQAERSNMPESAATNWAAGTELSSWSEITGDDRLVWAGAGRSNAARCRYVGKPTRGRAQERNPGTVQGRQCVRAVQSAVHATRSIASSVC